MDPLCSLPVEVLYSICDYFFDHQFLTLRLVSRRINSRISPQRLRKIHSVKSYFLTRKSIFKLSRLSCQSDQAKLVTHLKLDLARPFISLARLEAELEATLLDQDPSISSTNCFAREAGKYPYNENQKVLRQFCEQYCQSYVWRIIAGGTDGSLQLRTEGLFEIIADAIRGFPNLAILEITCSKLKVTQENRNTLEAESVIRVWKEYNPEVAYIFDCKEAKALELDVPTLVTRLDPIEYNSVFSDIVDILVVGQRRVSEIRLSPSVKKAKVPGLELSILLSKSRIRDFGKPRTAPEKRELEIFQGLSKLELHVSTKDWTDGNLARLPTQAAQSLLENVRELDLSMDRVESARPKFYIDTEMVLPRLTKLTIGSGYVELEVLENYMKLHNNTLRELKATWDAFRRRISRGRWILFLNTARTETDLERLDLEIGAFLTAPRNNFYKPSHMVALNVQISGTFHWLEKDANFHTRRITIAGKGKRTEQPFARHAHWDDLISTISTYSSC